MKPALLVMGPTASGKSALALALAERIGGEIVNADSMQVYRDFRILTARPTPEDEARAPHRLYGHVDASERYNTGRWLADALAAIAQIRERGATPIVVGGTGLYFKALTQGLAELPGADPEIRRVLTTRAAQAGAPALYAELARLDPQTAARLAPNDAPRIIRALEVLQATGESISAFQANTRPALSADEWIGVALTPSRAALYENINARFDQMLAAGVVEEVRAFAARKLADALPAMKAHGAPALMAYLRGDWTLEAAADRGKQDTRRYAKRQFTWIANQTPDWPRVESPNLAVRLEAVSALFQRTP